MLIYQPAGLHCTWALALHDMWVKDLTLNKQHRSNFLYVIAHLCVTGTRGMWAHIISENNNWRVFLFLCNKSEGKLSTKIGFRCWSYTEMFRLQS